MGNNLYVGNIAHSTNQQELEKLFADFGEVVSCKLITDQYTGKSRGFGFVEMANSSDAQEAMSKTNGFNLNSRDLVVNEAKPRTNNKNSNFERNRY